MSKPKTVLVTGAEGALGSVVARRFAEAGCQVVGAALKIPAEPVHRGGAGSAHRGGTGPALQVRWAQMNLADAESIRASLRSVRDAGPIDALVHCAGGFRWAKVDQLQDQDLGFLLDANLKSSFLIARELLPGMKERNFGRLVFVSSRATIQPPGAGMGAYAASKAGINLLTQALAEEVRAHDINVNAVLPTVIDTPANRRDMAGSDFSAWVKPEELAEIVFSLTQPWGKPIHGALIPVSGRL